MKNSWMILIVVVFSMDLAFCQEIQTAVLEPSLNPSSAKENLQTSYALKVAQLTINAIHAFKQKYPLRAPKEEHVNWFTRELLKYGEDNLVQVVKYVPEESLTIIMQDNQFVASLLRGKELIYQYYPQADEANQWKIKQKLPTIAATRANSLLRDIGMNLITTYCYQPGGFRFSFGMWPDTEWCPAWLQLVMPSPQ